MGAGISGGGPPWAHKAGGRAPEGGAPSTLVARWQLLPRQFLHSKSSNIPEKIILNWHGILRTSIFGIFLYCTGKPGNRQKNTIFTLFLLNNRKYRRDTESCASSFIRLMIIKKNPLTRLIKSC